MYFSKIYKHIFGVLIWLMLLFLIVILYYYSIKYVKWDPEILGLLDKIYQIIKLFLIAGFLTSFVGLIFYKIRHSRIIEKKLIRRFLPIINFSINTIIWIVIGFLILEALQVNTKNILAGAGITGALFALASKDLITNLLGSLSILFSRTFEIGDTIRIRTVRLLIEGLVEEITLNHTKVTNKTGEVVYVPNKTIYTESVENLSRRRFHSYEFILPFAKNANIEEVENSLKIIESKINSFHPVSVEFSESNANATDFMYTILVKLPKENKFFESEMRKVFISHIFGRGTEKNFLKEDEKKSELPEIIPENESSDII